MFEIDSNCNIRIQTSAIFDNQDHVRKDHSHAVHAASIALTLRGAALRLKKALHLARRHDRVKSKKLLEVLRREALREQAAASKADNLDDLQHQLLINGII